MDTDNDYKCSVIWIYEYFLNQSTVYENNIKVYIDRVQRKGGYDINTVRDLYILLLKYENFCAIMDDVLRLLGNY